MPTRDDLEKYSEDELLALLRYVVSDISRPVLLLSAVQYVFEIAVILECKKRGMQYVTLKELYSDNRWWLLSRTRNNLAHNLCDTESCSKAASKVVDTGILEYIAKEFLGDEGALAVLVENLRDFSFEDFKKTYMKVAGGVVEYNGQKYSVDDILSVVPASTVSRFASREECAKQYVEMYVEIYKR